MKDIIEIIELGSKKYKYFSLEKLASKYNIDLEKLPFSMKILLENLARNFDNINVTEADFIAIKDWINNPKSNREIQFSPARILMQDFTGVPAVVDLAAMRDAMKNLGGDPSKINPLVPVDLVIDHSVQVDEYATSSAFKNNVKFEMERNIERYEFLKWGQEALANFRAVPPGTGICHQVNLEYLAKVVWVNKIDGDYYAIPDTLVGTDSHTTMINGLSVLGWGVGGIEAEAAMLGQPISMILPEIVGFKLTGNMKEGTTATDLVLTVTEMLRKRGVVNKFVEFYGNGLDKLPLADRATIANMSPEYGATCGFFAIDDETLKYMYLSGRSDEEIKLVEEYAKRQHLWRNSNSTPKFTDILELDLAEVVPSLAGPKRPQDRVSLTDAKASIINALPTLSKTGSIDTGRNFAVENKDFKLANGDIVIAAITSCTNTSNPSVMIAAGLLARNAKKKGLTPKPWVKTSLAPGSQVVSEYLSKSGLSKDLDDIGFNIVGYGCTTCIGNSGPIMKEISDSITKNDIVVASILSGNRNFEGRIHPLTKANYLASPPLVVAYSLVGTMNIDIYKDPLGYNNGEAIYLKDIWPSTEEINKVISEVISPEMFKSKYSEVFLGDELWQNIKTTKSLNYSWNSKSTYIQNPPYFKNMSKDIERISNIMNANILAVFGDSITTDHISPAGNIALSSPAGKYLIEQGIEPRDFNSYGSRRGNHEVMMRGTFANIRIKNEMLDGIEGGNTKHYPSGEVMSIYDASMKYQKENRNLVIFAGKEYGTGSSRDWAAKGTLLLGIKAIIAESFERIHRSNLIGMGVLPLMFINGENRKTLNITGEETVDIIGIDHDLVPGKELDIILHRKDGSQIKTKVLCRVDTKTEMQYYKHGGIMQYMIRSML